MAQNPGQARLPHIVSGPAVYLSEGDKARAVDLRRLVTGRVPSGIPENFIFTPQENETYFAGTAIKALNAKWKVIESGLIVPDHLAQPAAPIDQISVYLTSDEIFGFPVPQSLLIENLRNITAEAVLRTSSAILADYRHPGAVRAEIDKKYAAMWFTSPTKERVLNLLREPSRSLVVPQVLYTLVCHSMRLSGDSLLPGVVAGNFVVALMAAQQEFGDRPESGDEHVVTMKPGLLGREMISNQIFNSVIDEAHLMARFARIWLQLSIELEGEPEIEDLEKGYSEIVGVPLRDVLAVGLILFSVAVNGQSMIGPEYFSKLTWDKDRQERALSVFSVELYEFRAAVLAERKAEQVDWRFDTFGRFPVVRMWHGGSIVLDIALLLPRIFGWLPIFDIEFAAKASGSREKCKRAERLKQSLRRLSEKYCAEVIDSIVGAGSGQRRVYHDEQLKAAYGNRDGVRIADAAIDYGDSWIVIEATTTQLKRDSVFGISDDSVVEDLVKLAGEAEQVDSSINSIRDNETALTGYPSGAKKKFFPVLVLTEGFPVNPISLTLLREHVEDAGLLQGDDVAPLEVVDIVELEIVESLQREGGPSLIKLLELKQSAELWRCSLRDFILVELKLFPRRPDRIDKLWHGLTDELARRMFGDEVVDQRGF